MGLLILLLNGDICVSPIKLLNPFRLVSILLREGSWGEVLLKLWVSLGADLVLWTLFFWLKIVPIGDLFWFWFFLKLFLKNPDFRAHLSIFYEETFNFLLLFFLFPIRSILQTPLSILNLPFWVTGFISYY